jgi:D-alanyl-D-alanine carboxypeptidase
MFDAAREAGVYPVVASGYRTTEDQERIMSEYIQDYLDQGYSQEDAQTEAEKWVAIPGTSEHQLGLGVDINADGVNSAGYEVYDWLEAHCWEYGFILRYPEDKTDITGISNEPWHFRYVGQEAAEYIMANGLCLEEYLEEIGS